MQLLLRVVCIMGMSLHFACCAMKQNVVTGVQRGAQAAQALMKMGTLDSVKKALDDRVPPLYLQQCTEWELGDAFVEIVRSGTMDEIKNAATLFHQLKLEIYHPTLKVLVQYKQKFPADTWKAIITGNNVFNEVLEDYLDAMLIDKNEREQNKSAAAVSSVQTIVSKMGEDDIELFNMLYKRWNPQIKQPAKQPDRLWIKWLKAAVKKGPASIVQTMIEKQWQVDLEKCSSSDEGTLLHMACGSPFSGDKIRVLATRMDINGRNERGSTALHSAAFCGDMAAVVALMERGIDVEALNKEGLPAAVHLKSPAMQTRFLSLQIAQVSRQSSAQV